MTASVCKHDGPELMAMLQAGEMEFISVAEFASILRVGRMVIYRMVESGELEANRVGVRTIRIPAGAALACLKESRSGG